MSLRSKAQTYLKYTTSFHQDLQFLVLNLMGYVFKMVDFDFKAEFEAVRILKGIKFKIFLKFITLEHNS
jgi:hypothetical protein